MSLQTITEINLDVNQPGVSVVHAKQYDTARQVKAHLFYNGVKWLVPSSNFEAVVGFKKADRIGGFYDETELGETAITVDGSDRSIIYIILDRNVVTTPGNVTTEITFYDSITTGRLSTFSFITQVEEASVTELDLSSSPYFNILAEDIKKVIEASESMAGMTATASKRAPNAQPTVSVSGGTSAQDPYVLAFGIPSMPAVTVSASTVDHVSSASATISGGQSAGQAYNIAFGIPKGVGVKTTTQHYGVSMAENTMPSSWVTSVTNLSIPDGAIVWTRIKLTYDDNTTATYYSKTVSGMAGPPGLVVSTTEPSSGVQVWIDPSDSQTIVIPDIKDTVVALDSTYSSSKVRNSFLAFDASQTLTETQQNRAYTNLGFPTNTLGKLGYAVVT